METDVTETFEASLRGLDVAVERTDAAGAAAVLADLVEPPAVGVPLPFDGVSLPEGVETAPTPAQLEAATTATTAVDFAVADYGSVAIRASPAGEEPTSLYADVHVAVVAASDVLPDVATAFERLGDAAREEDSDTVLATGPSATADMGALVIGAHGPRAVHSVVIEDR